MEVCAAYTGNRIETSMVVIEVELLSGYGVSPAQLEKLTNEESNEVPVKKFEIDHEKGNFVLYFDSMPKSNSCWTMELKQQMLVTELKPAIAKIYDYYTQEDTFSTEYNLE